MPPGFAITTAAYREHVARTGLATQLERLLADCTTYETQLRASAEIRNLFEATAPSPELAEEVLCAHATLCQPAEIPVAVRSSASAEDMADGSFAGQQETYLWILGGSEILRHMVRCWASLFTPQAIAYRAHLRTPVTDLTMGVIVQSMVPAEAAGVMLTVDPVTGEQSAIVIEAAYVANRGVWWSAPALVDVNALTPQIIAAAGLDINNTEDQKLLASPMTSSLAAQRGLPHSYVFHPAG